MVRLIAPLLVLIGCVACGTADSPGSRDEPETLRVTTAPGVELEVIDWGGSGLPLVFLGGGGHTAHEFDGFAPLFTDEYRAVGITRRGMGESSDVPPETFAETVEDIVAVTEELELGSVVLVGHSFASFEMTLFGREHGDRCSGLVYLDAAYDYTDPGLGDVFEVASSPDAPPMETADSASAEAVQAWVQRTQGFTLPLSEIRATRRFDSEGRLVGRPARTPAQEQIARLDRPAPDWQSVDCPSVGIYAVPAPPESWLPYYSELDSLERENAQTYFEAFSEWTARQREEFGQYPQNRVIEFPSSSHYFFLEMPEEASQAIRRFLSELE